MCKALLAHERRHIDGVTASRSTTDSCYVLGRTANDNQVWIGRSTWRRLARAEL
jgi:hypothetical protein